MMENIQNCIYLIRGVRVMLDFDLARIYEVETRVLNQAVKRQIRRFPADFMFQLTDDEWSVMMSQIVTSSQTKRKHSSPPYAFTEQGVAMLSGVLHSDKAIQMNIVIMRAFVEIRKVLLGELDVKEQLKQLKEHIGEHDVQLNQIYSALENLLDEKVAERTWDERQRIGFKS